LADRGGNLDERAVFELERSPKLRPPPISFRRTGSSLVSPDVDHHLHDGTLRAMGARMHEVAVCRQLLEQVAALALRHPKAAARRVVVEVGALAEIEPQRMMKTFSVLRPATVAHGATLALEFWSPRMRCGECGAELEDPARGGRCPECRQSRTLLVNADEFLLKRVEFLESGLDRARAVG
jgi:hydrogenase nickel incorporation protein HypA/HybF